MSDRTGATPRTSSPTCLACDLSPEGRIDDTDRDQARDVARWRKAQREQLLAARASLTVTERAALARALGHHLLQVLSRYFANLSGRTVALYWPIRSEPDLRPCAGPLIAAGARVALLVVDRPKSPLVFRPWAPGDALTRGHWGIPVPAIDARVQPDIALAPLVGWDGDGFRLGYGGGYFDRTLACHPRPFAIGTGLASSQLPTIFPQPHDIRLDAIVTDTGPAWPPA